MAEDRDRAERIVRAFLERSWRSANWELLIGKHGLSPEGCLIDALDLQVRPEFRKELECRAAHAVRDRFREESRNAARWRAKQWSRAEVEEIIQITIDVIEMPAVDHQVAECDGAEGFQPAEGASGDGFVGWRPFRARGAVSAASGVYLIALFDLPPQGFGNPQQAEVVYIGKAELQTLRARLEQFEASARGNLGHSGGWSYRTEVYPGEFRRLDRFHKTYVSWKELRPGADESPSAVETALINAYEARWGRLPRLNKRR